MKSLIVDDDNVSRTIFKTILSRYGRCDVVSSGNLAIDEFKTALYKGDPYNLIILDIMMPDINGNEVLKFIRFTEETRNIYPPNCVKIIITTGLDDPENRVIAQGLKEDCEAYLVKTGNINQELIDKLRELGFQSV